MSNIRSIVEGSVPAQYRTQREVQDVITNVVNALEQGLSTSLSALAQSARAAGVSRAQYDEALVQAGLMERPAPPAPAPTQNTATGGGQESAGAAVARLEATVNRLVAAASARGITL